MDVTKYKRESIYCGDCISCKQVPIVRGTGFRPICRMYETHLRTDKHGLACKDPKCIRGCGGNYL